MKIEVLYVFQAIHKYAEEKSAFWAMQSFMSRSPDRATLHRAASEQHSFFAGFGFSFTKFHHVGLLSPASNWVH